MPLPLPTGPLKGSPHILKGTGPYLWTSTVMRVHPPELELFWGPDGTQTSDKCKTNPPLGDSTSLPALHSQPAARSPNWVLMMLPTCLHLSSSGPGRLAIPVANGDDCPK